jgi:hypothetical protein
MAPLAGGIGFLCYRSPAFGGGFNVARHENVGNRLCVPKGASQSGDDL